MFAALVPTLVDVAPSCGPCAGVAQPGGLLALLVAGLFVLSRRGR